MPHRYLLSEREGSLAIVTLNRPERRNALSLDLMLERMHAGTFRSVLTEVRDKVKSGTDLSEAFGEYGDLFPRL